MKITESFLILRFGPMIGQDPADCGAIINPRYSFTTYEKAVQVASELADRFEGHQYAVVKILGVARNKLVNRFPANYEENK